MSQENVDAIRSALEDSARDPRAFLRIVDPQIRWEAGGLDMPDGDGTWHGPDGVVEFFARWRSAFVDWGFEVEDVLDAGDTVVVQIRQWGKGKTTGVPVESRFFQNWTFRQGRAVLTTHHPDRQDALEAARGARARARRATDPPVRKR
jgi:ketosteroid isomerase-like protein